MSKGRVDGRNVKNSGMIFNIFDIFRSIKWSNWSKMTIKMVENVENIPEFSTYVKNLENNHRFLTETVNFQHFQHFFDMNRRFSKIPVHFCEILYWESSYNFWTIFNQRLLTFAKCRKILAIAQP